MCMCVWSEKFTDEGIPNCIFLVVNSKFCWGQWKVSAVLGRPMDFFHSFSYINQRILYFSSGDYFVSFSNSFCLSNILFVFLSLQFPIVNFQIWLIEWHIILKVGNYHMLQKVNYFLEDFSWKSPQQDEPYSGE